VIRTFRTLDRSRRDASGQATVEFALLLPLVAMLAVGIVQVAIIVRDQILTVHAAREAVRVASVDANIEHVRAASARVLPGAHVEIGVRPNIGEPITVSVHFRAQTNVPLLGALIPDVTLQAAASMVTER
jgi:Flp pilus assembly pilin Flp